MIKKQWMGWILIVIFGASALLCVSNGYRKMGYFVFLPLGLIARILMTNKPKSN